SDVGRGGGTRIEAIVSKCPACKGDRIVPCAKCGAKGKIVCGTCNGKGMAGACATCSGARTLACHECKGTGRTPAAAPAGALETAVRDALRSQVAADKEHNRSLPAKLCSHEPPAWTMLWVPTRTAGQPAMSSAPVE